MIIGTAHFKDYNAAFAYYRGQGGDGADVEQKIRDGVIFIGKPESKPGDVVKLNSEGRYEIHTGSQGEEDAGIAIETDLISILGAATVEGNKLKLNGQLDRKDYVRVNKIIETIGGKWSKKDGAHVFKEDAGDIIDDILLTGTYRNTKKDLQQFDTPADLAELVVEMADIREGDKVYEPSCGPGYLIDAIVKRSRNVFANELDPKRHKECVSRHFSLFGAGGIGMKDFLTIEPEPTFDRIVANPPFARGQDADHITHMMGFLKPGGVLVSIASPAVKFRQDKRYTKFRELIKANNGEIIDVAAGAFKASGTQVSTVIIRMVRA